MTLNLNFLYFFWSRSILVQKRSHQRRIFHINKDRDFLALFFAFLFDVKKYSQSYLKKNERPRERTTTSTTENGKDDNHDGTSRDAKPNDGGRDPVGRGRFGTTGDE